MYLVPVPRFQLTSCASAGPLRGLRRRCGGWPSFSPGPSASPGSAWPSAGWNWSRGRGLRGKNRRRKRRLLGAYRLPLTGTPPGPVTLAASEPCREKRSLSSQFKERKKKHSHLCCFYHIKLYQLSVTNAAEEFPRIVSLNGRLQTNRNNNNKKKMKVELLIN